MVLITPNFNFNGYCEEAIHLYKKAFNGKIGCFLRYSEAKKEDFDRELSEEEKRYIYHAELTIGNQRIMMCDNLDVPFTTSLSLSLTITFDTKEQVIHAYDILKEGSTTIYPLEGTTYSSCRVVFVDRFGFRWGLMTEQTER